jgi:hypothetical protein
MIHVAVWAVLTIAVFVGLVVAIALLGIASATSRDV